MFKAGKRLSAQTAFGFCQTVAFVECLLLGPSTTLGVATLILLHQPGVRELFDS